MDVDIVPSRRFVPFDVFSFDVLSHSVFFHSTFCPIRCFSIRRFVPFGVFSIRRFFQSTFFPVDILSHSAFCPFDVSSIRRFVPFGVFSIQCFVPFGVLSFDVLSFDVLSIWRLLHRHFVGEPFVLIAYFRLDEFFSFRLLTYMFPFFSFRWSVWFLHFRPMAVWIYLPKRSFHMDLRPNQSVLSFMNWQPR